MVGLSGGVDSAVAAHLLIGQGHRVEALFMKNWEEDDAPGYCAAAQDLADAAAVAGHLGIELHTVNFAAEYWERVFQYFLEEYRALRTPNPDVLCNREIKFRAFLDHALRLGADWIATGHYARVTRDAAGSHLRLGADPDKDQTYFLHLLDQHQLARTLFPLADLTKREVRSIARELGLPNAAKRDSTGICFIGERRFRDFLARYLPSDPGPIETPDGRLLGEHQGLAYYTIGQRQGLGIGGVWDTGEAPWFVAAKDAEANRLVVVQGGDHPRLGRQVALQELGERALADEADAGAVALVVHRQRALVRDATHRGFGQVPDGKHRPGQQVTGHAVQEVGLVLGGVRGAQQVRPPADEGGAGIVAGREPPRAEPLGVLEAHAELDLAIAGNVGIRRASGAQFLEEVREHAVAVLRREVHGVQRNAELVADLARVLQVGRSRAVTVLVLVPVAHEQRVHVVTGVLEQRGRDGGIHAAGDAEDDSLCAAHAAILACSPSCRGCVSPAACALPAPRLRIRCMSAETP